MKKIISVLLALSLLLQVAGASAGQVVLPGGVEAITEESFSYTSSINEVVLPWGTETIENRAFANSGITGIYIPLTVFEIAEDAFSDTNVTFYCSRNSYARTFAENHGIPWQDWMEEKTLNDPITEIPDENLLSYRQLEIEPIELLSEEGETEEAVLDLIRQYNDFVRNENEIIEEYNALVSLYYENSAILTDLICGISVQEKTGSLLFTSEGLQAEIDRSALEILIKQKEIDQIDWSAEDQMMTLTSSNGEKIYFFWSGTGLHISTNPITTSLRIFRKTASNGKPMLFASSDGAPPIIAPDKDPTGLTSNFRQWVDNIAKCGQVANYISTCAQGVSYLLDKLLMHDFDNILKAFIDIAKSQNNYSPALRRTAEKLRDQEWARMVKADGRLRFFLRVTELLRPVFFAFSAEGLLQNWLRVRDIYGIKMHGHPNDKDLIPEDRRHLAASLGGDIEECIWLYIFLMIMDTVSLGLSVAKPVSFGAEMILGAGSIMVGNRADKLYSKIVDDDPKLHSFIIGTVTDETTQEPIPWATVTYPDGDYVVTDQDGNYEAPHLPGTASLLFARDSWEEKEGKVTVPPNCNVALNIKLQKQEARVWGVIRDEDKQAIPGRVTWEGGSASTISGTPIDGLSSSEFYSFVLPVGTYTFEYSWEGYQSVSQTVTLKPGDQILDDVELPWKYGLKGKIKDDSGKPVTSATIRVNGMSTGVDSEGRFKMHLKPGHYTVEVESPGYISKLLYGRIASQEITIPEDQVAEMQEMMINTEGKYYSLIRPDVGAAAWYRSSGICENPDRKGTVSWGKYTVSIDGQYQFYCISDTPNVTLNCVFDIVEFGTGRYLFTLNLTRNIDDLSAQPAWGIGPTSNELAPLFEMYLQNH